MMSPNFELLLFHLITVPGQWDATASVELIAPQLPALIALTPYQFEKDCFTVVLDFWESFQGATSQTSFQTLLARISSGERANKERGDVRSQDIQSFSAHAQMGMLHYFEQGDLKLLADKYVEALKFTILTDEIGTMGVIYTDGLKIKGKLLKGWTDAFNYFSGVVDTLASTSTGIERSEHDEDTDIALERLNAAEQAYLNSDYFMTGFAPIDEAYQGLAPGELVAVMGASGEGKSQLVTNWAYQGLLEGRSGVYMSLEMSVDKINSRFLALHSMHPKFSAYFPGIPAPVIEHGSWTSDQKDFLYNYVVPDFNNIPGKLYIESRSNLMSAGEFKRAICEYDKKYMGQYPLDYFILDYPDLLDKASKSSAFMSPWQNTNQLYQTLKSICADPGTGRPILGMFPTQVSREGSLRAEKRGGCYQMEDIATSSAIAMSCSKVFYVYSGPITGPLRQLSQCLVGCVKERDSQPIKPFVCQVGLCGEMFPIDASVPSVLDTPSQFMGKSKQSTPDFNLGI